MKKKMTAALAAALAVTTVGYTASAVKTYAPEELTALSGYLLGSSSTGDQDLNSDNTTDIFDMVEMRRAFNTRTGEFTDSVTAPTEGIVNWINRNVVQNGTTWLVQSGSAIEFSVCSAKSASVVINGDGSEKNGSDHRPRYAVIVDGEIILDECLGVKEKEVELFSGDIPRNATVKVIHLSEANNGAVGVSAIKTCSDAASPVLPTAEKDLHIEFVGDSITCAYGVEGKDQYEGFKTSTENFMKSYAYLTAQKLNAEYSTACYSGYGAVSSYSSDGSRRTEGLLGDHYNNVGATGYKTPWSHEKHPVDVVVVNIGTNDNTYVSKDYKNRGAEFTEAYLDLLKKIHKAQPAAKIVCTVGTMGCSEMYPYIEDAIAEFKKDISSDVSITSYLSATQDMNKDGLGSDWHPTAVTHQKAAAVLADKICVLLGIESDQIGLDIASESEYKAVFNKGSGADGATYFSDYDKSFWVNVTTSGKQSSDAEAVVSPVSLKKGGSYKLSFTLSAPKDMEIPVQVRSKDKKTLYLNKILTSKGEKTPFESEFTVSADDSDAEFSISFGGKDYSSVTLYELHIVKTA